MNNKYSDIGGIKRLSQFICIIEPTVSELFKQTNETHDIENPWTFGGTLSIQKHDLRAKVSWHYIQSAAARPVKRILKFYLFFFDSIWSEYISSR